MKQRFVININNEERFHQDMVNIKRNGGEHVNNDDLGALHRINSKMRTFKGVDLKLAKYILENPQKVTTLKTIYELSAESKVSESSIVRFYKKIGYQSYKDFSIALALDAFEDKKRITKEIKASDDVREIMMKLYEYNKEIFEEQIRITDYESLKKARDLILKSKRIEIYGIGGNGVLAIDLHHHLIKTGIPCSAYTDPKMMLMSASTLGKDDLMIGISHSGDEVDINFAFQVGKKKGAKCIGATNLYGSPITEIADVTLYSPFIENVFNNEPISFRYAFMNLFDTLYVSIAQKQKTVSSNILSIQDILRQRIENMIKGFS